jgi:hypothetical protein
LATGLAAADAGGALCAAAGGIVLGLILVFPFAFAVVLVVARLALVLVAAVWSRTLRLGLVPEQGSEGAGQGQSGQEGQHTAAGATLPERTGEEVKGLGIHG